MLNKYQLIIFRLENNQTIKKVKFIPETIKKPEWSEKDK